MGRMSDALLGGDLFAPPNPKTPVQITRRQDPSTSYEAATGIVHKLRPLQMRVLTELKAAGAEGLTDLELEERCGSHGSTFRTRRSELVEVGLVRDSGRVKRQQDAIELFGWSYETPATMHSGQRPLASCRPSTAGRIGQNEANVKRKSIAWH